MGRNKKASDRVQLNVWILDSQSRELQEVCFILGKNRTDALVEAIAYWLAAQQRMLGRQPMEVK